MNSSNTNKADVYRLKRFGSIQLYGVHAAGGMLFFANLIGVLADNIRFDAVQLSGLDRGDQRSPDLDIIKLSNLYADEIEKSKNSGPLFVCGIHGAIVLETGQRLLERNIGVDALIVFDSIAPHIPDTKKSSNMVSKIIVNPIRRVLGIPENIGIGLWLKKTFFKIPQTPPHPNPMSRLNGELLKNYVPKPYSGLICLIRSEEFANLASKEKHLERWGKVARVLRVYQTAGSHETIWTQPYVKGLGNTINEIAQNYSGGAG